MTTILNDAVRATADRLTEEVDYWDRRIENIQRQGREVPPGVLAARDLQAGLRDALAASASDTVDDADRLNAVGYLFDALGDINTCIRQTHLREVYKTVYDTITETQIEATP